MISKHRLKRVPGYTILGLLIAAISGVEPASAVTPDDLYYEIVQLHGIELGAGGRAVALGGAYRALSDDLSGLYWNPAGLASVRRIEFSLGMTQSQMQDAAQIYQNPITNRLSRTRLNELGMVFPFPTYRGSLVFAVGYHQVLYYDYFATFTTVSIDSTFQGDELEAGRLGLWSLGMAIDLSPMVSVGAAVRLWTGYNDYSWNSYEFEDVLTNSSSNLSSDLDLSGFNVMTGLLLRPTPWLRIGATLESPLKLSIDEDYADSWSSNNQGEYDYGSFSASYSYHISRPFRAAIGAAVLVGRVGLSADAVLNDWSQIQFADESPYVGLTKDQANREISRQLRSTADLHVGLEYWLPFADARLQAGYAYLPSPFSGEEVLGNKNVYSGGISVLLDPSLQVQATLALAQWDRTLGGWGEELQLTHLLITLSYRF